MTKTKLYLARACHNTGDTLFVFLKRPSKAYLKELGCTAEKYEPVTSGDEFTYWVNILLTRHNGFPVNVTPHNGYYEVKTAMHWRPYRYFAQFHEGPHFNDAESLYEYLVPNGAVRKTPKRDLRTALENFYRESNLTRRPQMLEKTFINLSKETYQFIEREGLASGDVFDYPVAELDDLINGTVGDSEQTLYARYIDDDGEVRYGELSQVNISRFDNTYYILCAAASEPQKEVKATATGLGEVIEEAYALFKANGEGTRVTVQSHNSDGTVREVLTFC